MIQINFKKLNDLAIIPTKAHPTDAGLDIYSIEDITVIANRTTEIKTGIASEILNQDSIYYFQIFGRSGLAKNYGVKILGGVIDESYRGEWIVLIEASCDFKINKGDKIAQAVLFKLPDYIIGETPSLTETKRGNKGFGSSGY